MWESEFYKQLSLIEPQGIGHGREWHDFCVWCLQHSSADLVVDIADVMADIMPEVLESF